MMNEKNAPLEVRACRELADKLNVMTFSKKDFLEEFDHTHRYLQAEIFELALRIVEHCAEDSYDTDGRNDWCKNYAKHIVNTCPDCF